jgi:hypothetical protein
MFLCPWIHIDFSRFKFLFDVCIIACLLLIFMSQLDQNIGLFTHFMTKQSQLSALTWWIYLISDDQKLRTLELNSWQILRLLQEQRPAFCFEDCVNLKGDFRVDMLPESIEEKLCHLLSTAFSSHRSLLLHQVSDFRLVYAPNVLKKVMDIITH